MIILIKENRHLYYTKLLDKTLGGRLDLNLQMCVSTRAMYKCVYVRGVKSLKEVYPFPCAPLSYPLLSPSPSPSVSLSLPAILLSTMLLMFLQSGPNPAAVSPEQQQAHTNEELGGP